MRLTSRVVQPPASGVPVAGARPGSMYISMDERGAVDTRALKADL